MNRKRIRTGIALLAPAVLILFSSVALAGLGATVGLLDAGVLAGEGYITRE